MGGVTGPVPHRDEVLETIRALEGEGEAGAFMREGPTDLEAGWIAEREARRLAVAGWIEPIVDEAEPLRLTARGRVQVEGFDVEQDGWNATP